MSNFNSKNYWENRYKRGGTSGSGSYNNLATFKANIINDFIKENKIKNVIDYGVGDGNQLKLLDTKNIDYVGIDVSSTAIENCKKIFDDEAKHFYLDTEVKKDLCSELVLSCDVIYHLIEDKIYFEYLDNIFNWATKFVIIYARDEDIDLSTHVKFRKFTDCIKKKYSKWKLIKYIPNKYPQTDLRQDSTTTSPSDFFIYEKI